jgi:esterase/lipase
MNEKYYQPSGYNSDFDFKGNDFADYIDHTRKKIRLARLDLHSDYVEEIIDANAPFMWLPKEKNTTKKRAMLMVHGLYNSPFSLRDLGHVFYQQGFLVYSVLLPGHGTVPGDLLHIHRQSWQQTIDFAVNALKDSIDELYLCGMSAGGLLCLDYHLRHPHINIKSIITLAPALKIKNIAAPLSPLIAKITPWLEKNNEDNYSKYRSFATRPVPEVYHLGRTVLKKNRQKKCLDTKLFMAFSNSDHVISAKTCEQFFRRYASVDSRCVIHHSGLNTNTDPRIHYLSDIFPETPPCVLRHNGLLISPENGYYGINSNYRDPKKNELLYNPQFNELAKAIVEFLK